MSATTQSLFLSGLCQIPTFMPACVGELMFSAFLPEHLSSPLSSCRWCLHCPHSAPNPPHSLPGSTEAQFGPSRYITTEIYRRVWRVWPSPTSYW